MNRHGQTWTTRLAGAISALALLALPSGAFAEESWKADWSVPEGFALDIDTEGFDLPTSIALVPNPGPNPKDPLYFVTELQGKVKVVTRDRSIVTFAEGFFSVHPNIPPPSTWGEIGMAGLALDPVHGYVFVSYLFHDANGIMRNGMSRFKTTPGVFGLKGEEMISFNRLFEKESSWVNYHIGPIVVNGDTLFVSVGDGGKPFNAQDLHYATGKILRMSLDGAPLEDNPYTVDSDPLKPQNFVWAYGIRNAFGLALVNGRLLASENGIQIDRFMEIEKGGNYNWDGTDWSIGMNAAMVFGPTVGPVQLAWLPKENALFPADYRSKLFMAMSYGQNLTTGVATLDYNFEKSKMNAPPRRFLLLKPPASGSLDFTPTSIIQKVVGVGFGSDGLYVVPMYPIRQEKGARSGVFKISFDPKHQHPYILDKDKAAETLMNKYACWYCHSREPEKKRAAPVLDDETLVPRLLATLSSSEYAAQLKEMSAGKNAATDGFADMRAKVMQVEGVERVRLWIKYRLINPQFDRKAAAMPAFNMQDSDADSIASYLVARHDLKPSVGLKARFKAAVERTIGYPRYLHSAVAGVVGVVFGWLLYAMAARRRAKASIS